MGNTKVLAILVVLGLGGAARAERPVAQLRRAPSYVEIRTARVLAALLRFVPARTFEEQQDGLGVARARDALRLPGVAESLTAAGWGAALCGAAVVLAAHAPAALRPIVDGPVHVGPALFDGGGLGAGLGGRF